LVCDNVKVKFNSDFNVTKKTNKKKGESKMKKSLLLLLVLCLVGSVFAKTANVVVPANSQISAQSMSHRSAFTSGEFNANIQRNREVLFQQLPEEEDWSAGVSDANSTGPYYVADNFYGVDGTITGISFTGLDLSNPWAACDEDPMTFDIDFYADNDGVMGDLQVTHEVTLTREATGVQLAGFDLFTWTGDLPAGVTMTEGWIAIIGTSVGTPADGWFLWLNSPDGDGANYADGGTGWAPGADALPDRCFTLTGESLPDTAPAAPTDVVVTPAADGTLTADLTWTNPSLDYAGNALAELTEMRVYRGTELVYTDDAPTIGGTGSYTDTVTESGEYAYSVVGFNADGEGLAESAAAVWIGEDVPASVTDIMLEVQDTWTGHVTWVNPTEGLHGGYFDGIILGYHIVRSDAQTFEVTGETSSFTDDSVTESNYYSYSVQPFNATGDGAITITDAIWIGESFSGILIIDLDPSPTGTVLQAQIENTYGGAVAYATSIDEFPITDSIEAVFLLLGIYADNYSLTEEDGTQLVSYVNAGGNIYLEGGDTWAFDTQTTLHGLFNVNGVADGSSDLANVEGADFLSGNSWAYTGENNWIDQLEPMGNAVALFTNADVGYNCGVANDAGNYKTIGTSFELAGLTDGQTAIDGILTFFNLGSPTGLLTGVVTDAETNLAIEGATVTAGNQTRTTDVDGIYTFANIVEGAIDLTCEMNLYNTGNATVTIIADETNTQNFQLVPFDAGIISGTITDAETNAAIEGAVVLAGDFTATSDVDGLYTIENVTVGTYTVTCTVADYVPAEELNVEVVIDETTSLDFALDLIPEEILPPTDLTADFDGDDTVTLNWSDPTASVGAVLFVDDDGSNYIDGFADTQDTYASLFTTLGVDFTVYETTEAGGNGPDATFMNDFDVVVWECGEQWSAANTLTPADEANLATFIDAGGKVIISAHDYMWDAYPAAGSFNEGDFCYDYLGIASVNQDFFTVGESQGGPAAVVLSGAGYTSGLSIDLIDIYTTDRDGVYLDAFTPNANAVPFTIYDGNNVGIQTANTIITTAGFAMYFYKMKNGRYTSTKKMILIK